MNRNLLAFLSFLVGGATGVLATKRYFEEKYKKESEDGTAQTGKTAEELELIDLNALKQPPIGERIGEPRVKSYLGYSPIDYGKSLQQAVADGDAKEIPGPYVITPMEAKTDGYEADGWNLFVDGVMTDDNDHVLDEGDIERSIGKGILKQLKTCPIESGSIWVRNELFKTDYEIVLNLQRYADVIRDHPYLLNQETDIK